MSGARPLAGSMLVTRTETRAFTFFVFFVQPGGLSPSLIYQTRPGVPFSLFATTSRSVSRSKSAIASVETFVAAVSMFLAVHAEALGSQGVAVHGFWYHVIVVAFLFA